MIANALANFDSIGSMICLLFGAVLRRRTEVR